MVAKILYTKNSPMEREATNFQRQLKTLRVESELVEADSQDGMALTQLYDLVARPAVALVALDGTLIERWQHQWPLATDVSYLAHQ